MADLTNYDPAAIQNASKALDSVVAGLQAAIKSFHEAIVKLDAGWVSPDVKPAFMDQWNTDHGAMQEMIEQIHELGHGLIDIVADFEGAEGENMQACSRLRR